VCSALWSSSARQIDVSAATPQQYLVGQEPVFTLVHRNTEPVAHPDRRLNLEQQLAPDGERHPLMQQTLRVQFSGIL